MSQINDTSQILFGKPRDELGDVERNVLDHSHERKILSSDTNAAFSARQTGGDRLSDTIAKVGGSWTFIVCFLLFLCAWTVANTLLLTREAFDPYPFIFLNLLLSMVAALQAPIIMMSQNRQAEKDRFDAAKDYQVNLKSEVELIALHHKIDSVLLAEIAALRADVARLETALSAALAATPPPQ
ncbi:DUF1003 domain-containing protein [Pararhizobium antarcticum]|uniref:Cyclic nucleotide-binding protein n=1 Tax=Pararhizobium antarcticum TaxID=1798805 RepID=A0A657LNZ9_9HYPH|nr:DUF1003 domain-containing protein [Pararhizobium antarcticum]OJF93434.1 hypothetical protein AX760_05385 [Pararhizobium antarcticum]OJG00462.1 hypothetical protein AX761_08585 [Rhizobium sp. 58]